MRGIYVPVSDPIARRALVNLAEREMRDPRDQAAYLILEGLRQRELLPETKNAPAQPAEAVTA
jgi:hypothetical protein